MLHSFKNTQKLSNWSNNINYDRRDLVHYTITKLMTWDFEIIIFQKERNFQPLGLVSSL